VAPPSQRKIGQMGVSTLQVANPSMGTVTRAPQTTAATPAAAGVPFARLSRKGQIFGPQIAGQSYNSLWTPILKPVGGYLRSLKLYVSQTGGTGTTQVATQDAPFNVIQNLFFRDPFGQPIVQADGYSLYLINLYSGQSGALGVGNDVTAMPSYISGAGGTSSNYSFKLEIPLELDSSGYCSLPDMNASSQPQVQIQLNTVNTVFSTPPGGTPVINAQLDEPFWMAPVDNPQAAPADVGSSAQWSVVRAAAGVSPGAYTRVQLPRVGTYIHTLVLVLRDATNARVDAWPLQDLTLWFDGVPVLMETLLERRDAMYTQFGVQVAGTSYPPTRLPPTGVIVYTFRDSIQSFISNGDTYDLLAPTTPATLLEVSGTFQSGTGPFTITTVVGELFPLGGIPYTHLAM